MRPAKDACAVGDNAERGLALRRGPARRACYDSSVYGLITLNLNLDGSQGAGEMIARHVWSTKHIARSNRLGGRSPNRDGYPHGVVGRPKVGMCGTCLECQIRRSGGLTRPSWVPSMGPDVPRTTPQHGVDSPIDDSSLTAGGFNTTPFMYRTSSTLADTVHQARVDCFTGSIVLFDCNDR